MNGFECGHMQGGGPGFKGCTEQCEECKKYYPTEDDVPFDMGDKAIIMGPALKHHFTHFHRGQDVRIDGHYYEFGRLTGLSVKTPNGDISIYHWDAIKPIKQQKMNKFKKGDKVILVSMHGMPKSCKIGDEFEYSMDFVSGGELGHIENDNHSIAAPWSSLQLKSEYDMQNNQNNTEAKRIPFDLERAKKGDKVIDREGNVYHDFHLTKSGVLFAWFYHKDGSGEIELHTTYNADGILMNTHTGELFPDDTNYKLFMAPVEKSGWIAIIRHKGTGSIHISDCIYGSKEDAMKKEYDTIAFNIVDITKISWTE